MNGNWNGPQGGSATGATITSFRIWQLCGQNCRLRDLCRSGQCEYCQSDKRHDAIASCYDSQPTVSSPKKSGNPLRIIASWQRAHPVDESECNYYMQCA